MSERRSTEIKFRTTPSFKARVQAAAAAADKSMSEYLEECAETRMLADGRIENIPIRDAEDLAPDSGVSTSGTTGSNVKVQPMSWMFEARK